MKKAYQILIILAMFVSANACESPKKENTESAEKIESEEASQSSESDVVLDNGNRWIANPETTEGINNMIQLMGSFSDTENVGSYKILTDSLESEFKMVFKKCTMKGEAHNQLHNFLLPMKATFPKLASSDLNECKTSFDYLNKRLATYQEFFE
jgi:hypothetical protein